MNITLKEGIADFVVKHPYMTSIAAGYVVGKALKAARTNTSTINVATNVMKFYARTVAERRIQKALVDTLISSKHYALVRTAQENGATVWTLRRQPH